MERCGVPLSMLKVTAEQGEKAVRRFLAGLHEIFLPGPEGKVRIKRGSDPDSSPELEGIPYFGLWALWQPLQFAASL